MPARVSERDVQPNQEVIPPYPREFAPFLRLAPLPVLVRSCLEWLVDQAMLDQLFEDTAQRQYVRELTLAFLVDVMLDVSCGIQPSAGAALKAHREEMCATRQAFYRKLNRMEPAVGAAIVKRVAQLAESIIDQFAMPEAEPIVGYRMRVVDGTYMGGHTEHRIRPLRKTNSAGLTCMALAVYAPAQKLIRQVVLEEDAYTQERALLDELEIDAGQVWLADRNFCVRSFLFRIHRAQSTFVIRWHGSSCPFEELEPLHPARRSKQGAMEHHVWLQDPDTQEWLKVRRIVLPLEKPTRNGDTELILVTNLPDTVAADELCDIYHGRWQIETHFQRLTEQLHCEPSGLNNPRAALFAFAMAATAGNGLAVAQQALLTQHGQEAVQELSYYQVVLDIAQTWKGMAIALPAEQWEFVRQYTPAKMARWLGYVAKLVPMDHYKRSRRAPKKPQPKRTSGKRNKHISVKRLLDQANFNFAC